MRKFLYVCYIALVLTHVAVAQEKLTANSSAARKLEIGKTDVYRICISDGDYVNFSLAFHGKINFFLLDPRGAIVRRLVGTSGDGKTAFPFVAEGAGSYLFKIENPGSEQASYEIAIADVIPLNDRLKPQPRNERYSSPRIQQLRTQLADGRTKPDAFWKEVAAEGTPLVEPSSTDGKHQLVTFLWRGVHDTRNVFVRGSFLGPGPPSDYSMYQIANTDIWYLTVKLPAGARFNYQLSPNDPLTWDSPRADQRAATGQIDPLNRHPTTCSGTSRFCRSIAELPGAVPQPWLVSKPGTPEGRVEKHKIRSSIQNLERPFSVYTPPNYSPTGTPNALVVLFDGEDLSGDTHPVTTRNNLIADRMITPTIAVFVDNLPRRRLVDMVANAQFTDFLAKELVPWIRANYNVTVDPARVLVGGKSAGGLAAPYVALRHPDVFGNVLSLSGAFWWSPEHHGGICGAPCPETGGRGGDSAVDATTEGNWMAKQFLASPKKKIRFYLTAGTFEVDHDAAGGAILETTRELRDVLRAQGYDVRYEQFHGGHDGLSWRGSLATGLISLMGRGSPPPTK